MKQKRHRVVEFVNVLLDIGDAGADAEIIRLALNHCGLIDHAGLLHEFHRFYLIGPYFCCALCKLELTVKQHQAIICAGNSADNLRLHGLTVILGLLNSDLSVALAVEDFAKDVYLPVDCNRKGIRPFAQVVAAIFRRASVGIERNGGKIAQLRALELSSGDLYVAAGIVEILVVLESRADISLKSGIGKHLLPAEEGE